MKGRMREIIDILNKNYIYEGINPKKLCKIFEELGPTFIKVGQILSTRVDLLPEEYIDELCKLRSNAIPLEYDVIDRILNEAYGNYHNIFKRIEKEPIGSASIAQVHIAYLNNDEQDIKRKWNKFFKTDYFTSNSQQKNRCENNEMFIENIYSIDKLMPIKFEIKCQRYISKDNFKNSTYVNCFDNQKFSITQNRDEKLCFSIDTIIPKPYILLWKIKNNGNYAIENNSLRGEIYYGNNLNSFADDSQSFKRFESISFKGNHYVECYLIKDNKCIAKSRFNVNIE